MGDLPRANADPKSALFLDDETRDGLQSESSRVTEPP